MRFITWNCRIGGFRRKSEVIAKFEPDLLAVQEVEPLEKLNSLAGVRQPSFKDRITHPVYPRRGIGTFSYTDLQLRSVDQSEPMHAFRRYQAQRGNLTFNVAVVWTNATKNSKTSYRQSHDGLLRHADWIRERPTVVLGDFNANASFRGKTWPDLLNLLDSLGLASAYHRFFREEHGHETRPTHFHLGREERRFHLDYCFLPEAWVPLIQDVQVGSHADWRKYSDHAPLIVDLQEPPGLN